jgi:anti-sigma factor RsiW
MTECRTPELQDLLPDFVSESLGDADRVRVTAHLAECDACTADLAILRRVRAARVPVASIDVSTIVAALPRPAAAATPTLQVHRGGSVPPSMRPAAKTPTRSLWKGPQVWRMAATLGVVLAGGFSVLVARRGGAAFDAAPDALQVGESTTVAPVGSTVMRADSAGVMSSTASGGRATAGASTGAAAAAHAAHANVTVSYGALDNATEAELQALIDRLEQWDGATSAEPAPSLPVVTSRGGVQP